MPPKTTVIKNFTGAPKPSELPEMKTPTKMMTKNINSPQQIPISRPFLWRFLALIYPPKYAPAASASAVKADKTLLSGVTFEVTKEKTEMIVNTTK